MLPTSHGSPDRFGFARQKPRPKEPQRSGIRRVDVVLFWSTRIDAAISGVFFECCKGDRVLATAGNVESESTLFDPAPAWACTDALRNATGSEFHKGVMLRLSGVPV